MSTKTNEKVVLKTGDLAPLFEAEAVYPDNQSKLINLETVLKTSRVMLVFYPGDDTPGCAKQLCGIRDTYADFEKYNVKVFGVNPSGQESHFNFIDKYNFQFPIIVDADKSIRQKYGAVKKIFSNESTRRGVILINTDQKIIFIHWGQQNNQEIFKLLEKK